MKLDCDGEQEAWEADNDPSLTQPKGSNRGDPLGEAIC